MKKFLYLALVCCIIPCTAYAWKIDSFDVTVDIQSDSSLNVTERIAADFSGENKHGINRKIPVVYQDETGRRLPLRFEIESIVDELGQKWDYTATQSGIYRVLKIGSPNRTYSGKKEFVIRYRVFGSILFLSNHDELFWTAIGTEWDTSIGTVNIDVYLPENIPEDQLMLRSFTGRYGSQTTSLQSFIRSGTQVSFTGERYLPYEGATIVVGFPKGVLTKPPFEETYQPQSQEGGAVSVSAGTGLAIAGVFIAFLMVAIPLGVAVSMLYVWNRYGKDLKLDKSVAVMYKPPQDLLPAEVGVLADDSVNMRDLSATIIDLAVRGYLTISKEKAFISQDKISFTLNKEYASDGSLRDYEKTLLDGIFGAATAPAVVELSSLENTFYKKLQLIQEQICDSLVKKDYYAVNPLTVTKRYKKLGVGVLVIGLFLFSVPIFMLLAIPLLVSGGIILGFARYMPAKNRRGMDTYGQILGFQEYLTRTEKDFIEFQDRQDIFERMLPYAVCLGVSKNWAAKFSALYSDNRKPSWYIGDFSHGFAMGVFTHDLTRSLNSMNHSFMSSPRTVSSGGGFGGGGGSGGGFGGGGGSSW